MRNVLVAILLIGLCVVAFLFVISLVTPRVRSSPSWRAGTRAYWIAGALMSLESPDEPEHLVEVKRLVKRGYSVNEAVTEVYIGIVEHESDSVTDHIVEHSPLGRPYMYVWPGKPARITLNQGKLMLKGMPENWRSEFGTPYSRYIEFVDDTGESER